MSFYTAAVIALILAMGAILGQFLGRIAMAVYGACVLIFAGVGAFIGMARRRP